MPEIWEELEGFSRYKFSNTGKILAKRRKIEMSTKKRFGGYLTLSLINDEEKHIRTMVHIMIALAFIPNPENKSIVNHKNNDKTDNRIENLEWSCEEWKELDGFSRYKFSNAGKIWSKYKKRLVSVQPIKYGSDRVALRNNEGKNVTMPLDIMIALAFIPNPKNKPTVNHKNNDKTDNRIENLEWSCDEWKELTGFSKYLFSSAGKIWSKKKTYRNISSRF